MRYTLITFLACPVCLGDLAIVIVRERPAEMPTRARATSPRVAPEGAVVAPLGPEREMTELRRVLSRYAASPAPAERDCAVEVDQGMLVCQGCARWFPVTGLLPELLPDHLRDRDRDARFFEECARALPSDLADVIRNARPRAEMAVEADRGTLYKQAEIGIRSKVDDPHFFSPGYSSPFNPHGTDFTLYLIKLFGASVPLLELNGGDVLLDSGCGYAWTTEWLYKAGVEAIGVDICRTYLEIGIERMGANRPHLVVADVENLPVRSSFVDAILAFESAHHIPNRKTAMAGFSRVLKPGGRMVLAEPGAAHEHAKVSVDVMNKYGILEKGMELDDVQEYVAGTQLGQPEQIFLLRSSDRDIGATIDRRFVQTHSAVEGNLFRISRKESVLDTVRTAWREPRRVVWPKVKRRVKSALVRLGLE
jgi:SAM-dependent methyltransferase/uncharacterized protein YbaR (Trm112 family)